MFKGADFSVVRLRFVVWLGGGGGIYSLSAFSQVCAAAKSFVVRRGDLFVELELIQNIRDVGLVSVSVMSVGRNRERAMRTAAAAAQQLHVSEDDIFMLLNYDFSESRTLRRRDY